MKKFHHPYELFIRKLQEAYAIEKHWGKAIPELMRYCENHELAALFVVRQLKAGYRIMRLEQVFESLGEIPAEQSGHFVKDLIRNTHLQMKKSTGSDTRLSGIVHTLRTINYLEISYYETLITYAETKGYPMIGNVLEESVEESLSMNSALTRLAMEKSSGNTMPLSQALKSMTRISPALQHYHLN